MPAIDAAADAKNGMETGVKYLPFIIATLVLIAVLLLYVWSHLRMTEMEYKIAEEMAIKERLLEEQNRLKVEFATLKSPQRIETIAREKLDMFYPERDQVVILK
jgi:cell division protein FtsL